MSDWPTRTLGDVLEIFDSRRVPLSSAERATRQGPYPYYGAQGVIDHIDDFIFDGRFILIPEDGENLRSRKLPVAYFAEGQFWVNNHAHIVRAKDGVAVDRFVQSAIEAADISPYITGAAQPKLSQANLLRIEIPLPEVRVQRLVAMVLDAFDDLIENSRRRMAVLEEMASAIYREWFVHFRFPGHEDATFIDSALGPTPGGWHFASLGSVAAINRQSRTVGQDETVRYLDISCLGVRTLHSPRRVSGAEAPGRARRVVSSGDIVWSMVRPNRRGHALLVAPGDDWIASTGIAVVTPTGVQSAYLFEALSSVGFTDYLASRQRGAAYPAVKSQDFNEAPILIPDARTQAAFGELVSPMHTLAWQLNEQTERLVAIREMLLPKLVTGQINVSRLHLDAVVEKTGA